MAIRRLPISYGAARISILVDSIRVQVCCPYIRISRSTRMESILVNGILSILINRITMYRRIRAKGEVRTHSYLGDMFGLRISDLVLSSSDKNGM